MSALLRCRRCLYEIGFTPQDKLTLLTHGFDKAAIADAFDVINVAEAQAGLAHCPHSFRDPPCQIALAKPKPQTQQTQPSPRPPSACAV